MPSVSSKQQKIMGVALAYKRGKGKKPPSAKVKSIMHSMSLKQLEEFAKKK